MDKFITEFPAFAQWVFMGLLAVLGYFMKNAINDLKELPKNIGDRLDEEAEARRDADNEIMDRINNHENRLSHLEGEHAAVFRGGVHQ